MSVSRGFNTRLSKIEDYAKALEASRIVIDEDVLADPLNHMEVILRALVKGQLVLDLVAGEVEQRKLADLKEIK